MKKILIALMFILALGLTGCDDTPKFINEGDTIIEYNGEPVYTQEEIDEMMQEIYDAFEDIESNDGYIENTYVNHNELDLSLQFWFREYDSVYQNRIADLEQRIEELEILVSILSDTDYNTNPFNTVEYNDEFGYKITNNDNVLLAYLITEYDDDNEPYDYVIHIFLERFEDGDFYYTGIRLYNEDSYLEEGYQDLEVTTHYGSSAVTLIQHIIEDEDWTLFNNLEDWEELKLALGIVNKEE